MLFEGKMFYEGKILSKGRMLFEGMKGLNEVVSDLHAASGCLEASLYTIEV
jgi:hypothetical protein